MGQAIGDLLPAAVGVAISPLPIVAVVLMLVSARGRANGPAFLIGWLVGVAGAGAVPEGEGRQVGRRAGLETRHFRQAGVEAPRQGDLFGKGGAEGSGAGELQRQP